MKKILSVLIGIVTICHFHSLALSWDNEKTHKDLSEIASFKSILGNTNYLKNIGLEEGLLHLLKLGAKQQEIYKWIQEGAFLEDAGSFSDYASRKARSFNHFHNPLKPWDIAGLDDYITIPNLVPPLVPPYITIYTTGESALKWAQDKANQQSYSNLEGDQTWQTIRNHYYSALTVKTDLERQGYFAMVFKGLGHQIHLIQDMAVPDHVRNDAHPEDSLLKRQYITTGDYYFETWAKNNVSKINTFASTPAFPQVDLTDNPGDMIPITQFYDTDQYNENVVPTKSLTWGLSEYTNANFISDDTIFTENFSKNDGHYFPYPRYTDQNQCYEQFEEIYSATNKKRIYWRKKCVGEPVEHFVTVGPLFKYLYFWDLQRLTLKRDEASHNDYAQKLIPRAVGYSAGLLNYFFRGDINMVPNDSGSGFVIENNSDEDMNGTFELWYDDANDNRIKAWSSELSIEKKDTSTNISSTLPTADKYILVFQGKMGNEDGAVVGKIIEKKTFLFFVNLSKQLLAFEMKTRNNKYELIPSSEEINFITGPESSLLILQSHPNQNEHVVILPYNTDVYYPHIIGFGVRRAPHANIGTQYIYRPVSFYKNDPYKLYKTAFYPLNVYSNPNLEAVGRKSYTLSDDNSQMVSFGNSVWKKVLQTITCSGNAYEEGRSCNEKIGHYMIYIDSTYNFVEGVTLGNDELYTYEYYGTDSTKEIKEETTHDFVATISDDKAIFKKNISSLEVDRTNEGYVIDEDAHCCNVGVNTEIKELSDDVSLIIEDASIVSKTGVGSYERVDTYWHYNNCGNCGYKKIIKHQVYENIQYSLDVIDYDNLYNDNNIILFYKVTEQSDSQDINETWEHLIGESISSHKETTLTTTYHLYYKSNSISNIINLPFIETYQSENQDGTITETHSGERVTGVSSQINDKNIVYTYIVERWTEDTEEWNFIKRIIGIINIADPSFEVGYTQEFEISESNASDILTDIYADYDYKDLAAIGVHVN